MERRYKITVNSEDRVLFYFVKDYENVDGRVKFVDELTGFWKDFPYNVCVIEEVEYDPSRRKKR